MQRILGQKKRLLRLGLLADQRESETQESSVNDTTNNQNESSVNDTTNNQNESSVNDTTQNNQND